MEALIFIVGLFLLFWFSKSIKKLANLAESTINSVVDTSEDTLAVYTNEVKVNNGKQRGLQRQKITKLLDEDSFSNQEEIDTLLATLNKKDNKEE